MYDVKITAIRKADYKDLQSKYENPIEHTMLLRGRRGCRKVESGPRGCVRAHGIA